MRAPHSAAAVPVHQLRESYTKGCPLYEFSPVFPFTALLSPQTTRFTALAALDLFFPSVSPNSPGPAWSTAAAVPHPLGVVTDP